jgi:IS5 family transposase
MAEVDRLTGEVARIAKQTLRQVGVVGRNARRAWARRPGDGRLGRVVGELKGTIGHTQRLLWQTQQRLGGNRVFADRLVSLSDPDARPIRKGKPQHPTQFGYTLLLGEDERGFIADHQLQQGNPPDAGQLVAAVERVMAVTGRPPGTVAGDRGFGTAANDRALAELGVARIGLQRNGTPGTARRALERTRASRRMRNWRVGIEARISHLKRGFGLRAAPGFAAWPVPGPGSGVDLRLQPAADDGRGGMTAAARVIPLGGSADEPGARHSPGCSIPSARLLQGQVVLMLRSLNSQMRGGCQRCW